MKLQKNLPSVLLITCIAIKTECAQQSNSHYQLKAQTISLQKPTAANSAHETLFCEIRPSSIRIQHMECYLSLEKNARRCQNTVSTIFLRDGDYEKLERYSKEKKTAYVQGRNTFGSYETWFEIDPLRTNLSDKKKK